jgi:protein gp37
MTMNPIGYVDETWNPIQSRIKGKTGRGYHCTKCSPGCDHCWAERINNRFGNKLPFDGSHHEFELVPKELVRPLHWKKPRRIFVQDMGDLFHWSVRQEYIAAVYGIMSLCLQHTFFLLTKREDSILHWHSKDTNYDHWIMNEACSCLHEKEVFGIRLEPRLKWPLENVISGLTVCNQTEYDNKIRDLMNVPGRHWLSIEPMLSDIILELLDYPVDFVVLGGENGPGARPMNPDGVRWVRDQCKAAGVPFWFKGWGEYVGGDATEVIDGHPGWCSYQNELFSPNRDKEWNTERVSLKVGRKESGCLLDGKVYHELPKELAF